MNIGDYVRIDGYISKIGNIRKSSSGKTYVQWKQPNGLLASGNINIIEKSSSNIIDLIEVGDLVKIENEGWVQVSIKFEVLKFFDNSGTEYLYEEIKGIITKEQIASIEYKIGE